MSVSISGSYAVIAPVAPELVKAIEGAGWRFLGVFVAHSGVLTWHFETCGYLGFGFHSFTRAIQKQVTGDYLSEWVKKGCPA